MNFRERVRRSLVKSITFRVVVVVSDMIIFLLVTHRVDVSVGLTVFTNLASTLLYYVHERAWNNVRWGKAKK